MTPVDLLLAGVVILFVAALLDLYALDHQGRGSRKLHLKITLVPPSLAIEIEQTSD
jgi:hypothetical protein